MNVIGKAMQWWRGRRAALRRDPRRLFRVSADAEGLTVVFPPGWWPKGGTDTHHIEWKEVRSVELFKTDDFTVDTIWAAVHWAAPGEDAVITTHFPEEAEGWSVVMDRLPKYLPGCRTEEEWFRRVAIPPFAENRTDIYERGASHDIDDSS